MSRRSRRAAAPVSSSASTTIRPLTMCRPPAKRSIEETSDLRQQAFVTCVLASSAFTCAVIAICPILPRVRPSPSPLYREGDVSDTVATDPVRRGPRSPYVLPSRLREETGIGTGQLGRIMPRSAVPDGEVGDHEVGPEGPGALGELVAVDHRGPVGEHHVDLEVATSS